MDIIRPDNHTFPLLESFVQQYEEKCVLLCSHIRRHSDKIFMLIHNSSLNGTFVSIDKTEIQANNITKESIMGVVYLDSTVFHCIPSPSRFTKEDTDIFVSFVKKFMNGKKIKCISGENEGTTFLEKLCKENGKDSYQTNNYKLMTITKPFPDNYVLPYMSDDDKIIRCTEKEIDELFNIQKKYLQDEVAPKGKEVTDLEVKMTLRQILKNQLCLAVFSDGLVCSKANTNAIGINWIQIGGVYTHPLYRRNGYALNLVYTICKRALKVGKNITLFVKEKNQAAIDLYNKLGFHTQGLYKIVYY